MSFATAINCMDGRVQRPVLDWMEQRFGARWIDAITEAGPVRPLADEPESPVVASILARCDVSTGRHGSRAIAVVAHADCAGNPAPEEVQREQLARAVRLLRDRYPVATVVGLWVDEKFRVHEVPVA